MSILVDYKLNKKNTFPALKSTSDLKPQSTKSLKSYSNSEANSSCCQKSDSWS